MIFLDIFQSDSIPNVGIVLEVIAFDELIEDFKNFDKVIEKYL